jgi:hypothetical protein
MAERSCLGERCRSSTGTKITEKGLLSVWELMNPPFLGGLVITSLTPKKEAYQQELVFSLLHNSLLDR